MSRIQMLEDWVQQGLQPDMVIILDAPVAVGRARAGKRSVPDRIESEQNVFFERVRQVYLQRAAQCPERYHVVDAKQNIDAVKADIIRLLEAAHG